MNQTNRILRLTIAVFTLFPFLAGDAVLSQTTRPAKRGEVHYRKGSSLAHNGRGPEALVEFNKAIDANPNDPRYFVARAECMETSIPSVLAKAAEGDERRQASNVVSRIESDIDAALRLDPKYARAYFARASYRAGLDHLKLWESTLVLTDFDRAIELEPKNAEFHFGRGGYYLNRLKDETRGLADYATAIRLQPRNVEYLEARGHYYHTIGEYEKVILDLTEVLNIRPRRSLSRNSRALAYLYLGHNAKALNDINLALRYARGIEHPLLSTRAIIYRKMGQVKLAEADERRAEEVLQKMVRNFD